MVAAGFLEEQKETTDKNLWAQWFQINFEVLNLWLEAKENEIYIYKPVTLIYICVSVCVLDPIL